MSGRQQCLRLYSFARPRANQRALCISYTRLSRHATALQGAICDASPWTSEAHISTNNRLTDLGILETPLYPRIKLSGKESSCRGFMERYKNLDMREGMHDGEIVILHGMSREPSDRRMLI